MTSTGTMQIAKALGAESVTLRYEDGGKIQLVTVDGVEYRVPGHFHTAQIVPAIQAERQK